MGFNLNKGFHTLTYQVPKTYQTTTHLREPIFAESPDLLPGCLYNRRILEGIYSQRKIQIHPTPPPTALLYYCKLKY